MFRINFTFINMKSSSKMNKQIQAYDCPLHRYDKVLTDNLPIDRASYFKGKSFP